MKGFQEIIQESVVCLNMAEKDGLDVIAQLVSQAVQQGVLKAEDEESVMHAIISREQSAPTAQPEGIAIPHGRISCISEVVFLLGLHPEGVDFGAPDGLPTRIFALMLAPQSSGAGYIQFLAKLCQRLLKGSIREQLLSATSKQSVCEALLQENRAL
jgi:mannitol/fructose-specific phosphotransferase system IIA component (Ntr-type)